MSGIRDPLMGTRAVLPRLMGAALLVAASLVHGATLAVQPQVGEPATKVDVRGSGMGAFEAVELHYDDTALGVAHANAEGAFRADDVAIPAAARPGRRPITAVGRSSGTRATVPFLVRSNWPQFHRGTFRHGEMPHENGLGPDNVAQLKLLWSMPAGLYISGSLQGSPVVADSLVYILTSDYEHAYLLAIDAATGAKRWARPIGRNSGCDATPAVTQGRVYAPASGRMAAFDARTGAVRWRAGASVCSASATATVVDGKLFTVSSPGTPFLEARDPASGRLLWRREACVGLPGRCGASSISNPLAAGDGVIYLINDSSAVAAFSAANGRQIWFRFLGPDDSDAAPVVEGDVVYLHFSRLYALNRRTGALLWSAPKGEGAISTPALADGLLYVGSYNSGLTAIDARTGNVRWQQRAVGGVWTSPAVANGVVYLGATDGRLYALDARTGAVLHSIPVAPVGRLLSPSPAVADGVVYVGTGDRVMAFGLRAGAADTGR